MHQIAFYFVGVMIVVTYLLELWTGCAIAGWAGGNAIVRRDESPGPYWFAMAMQTAVLVVIGLVPYLYL